MPEPRILAIANQKGGVGKTTTAINLGTALAAVGRQVLLIDLDPQGNASTGMGIDKRAQSIQDVVLDGSDVLNIMQETQVPNLFMVPATQSLASADVELAGQAGRARKLRMALRKLGMDRFDYVLIDCPPALGLLTLNALVAADRVLVPLQAEFFALEGLKQLLESIKNIRASANPQLDLEGIVLTMYDKRNKLSEDVRRDVQARLGNHVFETVIPRNVRLSEAPSHAMPALLYDHKSAGAIAYQNLAAELLVRANDSVAA